MRTGSVNSQSGGMPCRPARASRALTARPHATTFQSMLSPPPHDSPILDSIPTDTIANRLSDIQTRIRLAARVAGREEGSVSLVAVSKTHPAESILQAVACGQRLFGENRVQEAAAKFPGIRRLYPDIRLHLIGALQTNKAFDAVQVADVIETLDRPKLLDALAQACERAGRRPDILVQVNVGDEPQKAGVSRAGADDFISACRARLGDAVTGLMCIPPLDQPPGPHFSWLAACAERHSLSVLSMGMSADFEDAIAHGATHVRVGSAIFGHR